MKSREATSSEASVGITGREGAQVEKGGGEIPSHIAEFIESPRGNTRQENTC